MFFDFFVCVFNCEFMFQEPACVPVFPKEDLVSQDLANNLRPLFTEFLWGDGGGVCVCACVCVYHTGRKTEGTGTIQAVGAWTPKPVRVDF